MDVKRKEPRQEEDGVVEDKISNLPDAILVYILSFLRIKKAVSTSILSKRWKSLWTFVPTLSIGYQDFGLSLDDIDDMKDDMFIDFVDSVLIGHKMPCLEEIDITCSCIPRSCVKSWISAAVEQDVRTLMLASHEYEEPICNLPRSLFTMNKIVALHLDLTVVLSFPVSSVCFPNLKNLLLCMVKYKDDNSAQNLISSCPVLEELVINRDGFDGLQTLNVNSRTLKRLSLFHGMPWNVELDHVPRIIIECPAVEYIHIEDNITDEYVVRDLSSIVNAKLDVSNRYPFHQMGTFAVHVFELLTTISNVKTLSISDSTMLTMSAAYAEILPTFHHLTCLEFYVVEDSDWSMKAIIEFLTSTPVLEVLIFEGFSFSGEEFNTSEVDVPTCLTSHLKTIEVNGYLGKNDVEKIRYFLENSKVLENMTIKRKGGEEELKKLPRSSRACRVSVS